MKTKNIIFLISVILLGVFFVSTAFVNSVTLIKDSDKVKDILNLLGDKKSLHYISQLDSNKVKAGFRLVTTGFATPDSKKQSKHFVCNDCHNLNREDYDLTKSDPDTRLDYVVKNNIKFLPATTLFGQVNKKHWYNGDYYKKYGELVKPARDTLENAIQLCATVCSQGRALEEEEMDVILHYFNSIGYTIKDLNLTKSERVYISRAMASNSPGDDKNDAMGIIESKYLDYSPATFMKPMELAKRKQGKKRRRENLDRGKQIYELSCLTCHKEGGVTNYKLSNEIITFKHLKYWAKTNKVFSVYDIIRKGTYTKNGYKPYMPNYTKERLSDQQIEDLMAYIRVMAKDGEIRKGYVSIGIPSF